MTVPPEPPASVTIEPADSEDAERLADLWIELATDQRQYDAHLEAEENRLQIHETMLQHIVTETAMVARRAGRTATGDGGSADNRSTEAGGSGEEIVGFVTFGTESGKYEQDSTRGIIHNIFVREGDRGEGIGSGLVDAAERTLKSRGATVVALQAMAGNEAAISFYQQRGYTPHRIELEKPINGDPLDSDED